MRAVLESQAERAQHLLDRLPQIEGTAASAALVHRHLLEVTDQIGGTSAVALQQIDGLAPAGKETIDLRAAQAARFDRRREAAQLVGEQAGHDARVAQRRIQFVCHAGDQIAQRRQFLGLHELVHRLAQLARALADQVLEVLPVALQFLLGPLAVGDVEDQRQEDLLLAKADDLTRIERFADIAGAGAKARRQLAAGPLRAELLDHPFT
ncbi:MAG: hypothetical protein AW07_01288 [Candidatus Accumulibacter sp. SK-11]|nr:MAG: hypothetical protein AW07_01288 [Candidatus Accumulibacter sp. SK-11]